MLELYSYPVLPAGTLIADNITTPNGGPDSLAKLTVIRHQTVSAALEIQSTDGGLLLPRMNTTQQDNLVADDGMIVFNTDDGTINYFYQGTWYPLDSSEGPIFAPMVTLNDGTAGSPTLNFIGDMITGLFLPSAGTLGITASGALQLAISGSSSDVNYIQISGATTGNSPTISVEGSDANIGMNLISKGTGVFQFQPTVFPGSGEIFTINTGDVGYVILSSAGSGSIVDMIFYSQGVGSGFNFDLATLSNNLTITPGGFSNSVLLSTDVPGSNSSIALQSKGNGTVSILSNEDNSKPGLLSFYNAANSNSITIGVPSALADTLDYTIPDAGANATFVVTTSDLTDGQLLIGSTGLNPVASTLTPGTGISITNAAGSITITNIGGTNNWATVSGTSQSMSVNNRYAANNAGLVTFTLPAVANPGDFIEVWGQGAGGWKIAQGAAAQVIHVGNSTTTMGTGGSLASTNQWDDIYLVCVTANTTWSARAPEGNITVV